MPFHLFKKTELKLDKEINSFWDWFTKNSDKYFMLDEPDQVMLAELKFELKKIDEGLVFEIGNIINGQKTLTISADGIRNLFSIVKQICQAAPQMEKWVVKAFRQAIDSDDFQVKVGSHTIQLDDVFFRYYNDEGKLSLELSIRNYKSSADMENGIFILLDALIGEYDMETKIGFIEIKPLLEEDFDGYLPIKLLKNLINELRSAELN